MRIVIAYCNIRLHNIFRLCVTNMIIFVNFNIVTLLHCSTNTLRKFNANYKWLQMPIDETAKWKASMHTVYLKEKAQAITFSI